MTINSYFYDSVGGDRLYSAADFAAAFNIILKTGIMRQNDTGKLGFDIGGADYTTMYAGTAVVQGRFIELTGIETLDVPAGSYSGMVVLKVDFDEDREAKVIVKKDRTPVQNNAVYELPLYNVIVTNGVIGLPITDLRIQGGTLSSGYSKDQLDAKFANKLVYYDSTDPNYLLRNASKYFYGTGNINANYLISIRDTQHAGHYLILLSHFHDGEFNIVTKLAGDGITYQPNEFGTIGLTGVAGTPYIRVLDLGKGVV